MDLKEKKQSPAKGTRPRVIGVIPARYASTRFPGKPLALIAGQPMLQWVVQAAQRAKNLDEVLVATDDERIYSLAESFGVEAVMTASSLPTGSDRVREAVKGRDHDVAVVIQGDEPLLQPEVVDALVEPFFHESDLEMATLSRPLTTEDLRSPNTAKIVVDHQQNALYFSRLPVPFSRDNAAQNMALGQKHIGLYAYRGKFLQRYCEHGPCELEKAESLEQLRALYLGAKIRVISTDAESWGVDTEDDVQKIEALLRERGN